MQGQYKTQKGEIVKVEIFDAENKMVYVQMPNGQHKWFIESESKDWTNTAVDVTELSSPYRATPEEILSEPKEVKPKKPTPNKNASNKK